MPVVTILPQSSSVEAPAGSTLLSAILAAVPGFSHRCGGGASCGSCHIFLQEGRKGVSRAAFDENSLLDSIPGVGSKSRLACQVRLGEEPVTVELLGFSSGF